jgi:sulfatase maturation enzyme AslB (radical SAM superfamily)
MHISRFVVTYRDIRPGEHVFYDVVSDQYVGVDDLTLAATTRWQTEAPRDAGEREVQEALTSIGILVASEEEDDVRLRAFLDQATVGIPGTMYVTLMPTLACNLACNYCFQKDHPTFNRASDATETSTVEWVLRRVDAAATPKLMVHYFGGEPLTRRDYLLRTAEIFSAAMKARGGSFAWEMTTNGVGLDTASRAFRS